LTAVLKNTVSDSYDLISAYIPHNRQVLDVIAQLRTEKQIASNIKDGKTKQNITTALDMMIERLKGFENIPERGLALFCGHYDKDNAIRLTTIQPENKTIDISLYRCDNHFTIRDDVLSEVKR